MVAREDVCVLVPTLNEAETIGDVIDRFREQGFGNVLVIDGGSSDETREIALERSARVIEQSGSGKGQAVREAFEHVTRPYVILVDGDGTYRPEEADRLLEPLADSAEHVVGNRFANVEDGAMPRLNRVGNRLINAAFRFVHGRDYADILSGYRAFTVESVERFDLSADGFGIETELSVECARHDIPTRVVPITYESRPAGSEPNLNPFRDGAVILYTLYALARTHNPLFYFGSVGLASTLVGLLIATYVGYRWVAYGIGHEILAVVAAAGILFGVQLLMFGVLSDLIVSLHREQMRLIERLDERNGARERARGDTPKDRTEADDEPIGGRDVTVRHDDSEESSRLTADELEQ